MSIKTKLVLAFGGLIVILVVVSLVTFHTLNESSKAIDRIMRENYRQRGGLLQNEGRHRTARSPGGGLPVGKTAPAPAAKMKKLLANLNGTSNSSKATSRSPARRN